MKKAMLVGLLIVMVSNILAISSYTDSGLVSLDTNPPELQLLSPNGGETWYIGDTNDITWAASHWSLNPNSVQLFYSLNGGTTYTSLAEAIANTGNYPWEIPFTQSYNARVRIQISDNYGNLSQKYSVTNFSITYVPPAPPESVNVNTANSIDAVITWQAVTHTIPPYNSDITPDGYIVLYNESPYEQDEHFYYFLGRSYTTSYTHHDVAEFRNQMFYRVVAYKNYRDEDFSAVERLAKVKPLLWKDALDYLRNGGDK